jgi:hypothetical membrane protein
MSRKFVVLLAGAFILIADAVQWLVAEALTASAWADPPYSYLRNYISDLGVPDCGTQFQGRNLCSPWHSLMNTSFILEGILFAVGVILLARLVPGRARTAVIALAAAHGVGMVLVGLFHGSAAGPDAGLIIHVSAAGVGILCANTVAILSGVLRGLPVPAAYRRFGVIVGALGLLSEALTGLSPSTAGLFERGGVYSWLLWSAVTGVLVVSRVRRPVLVQNVSA